MVQSIQLLHSNFVFLTDNRHIYPPFQIPNLTPITSGA